MKRSSGISLVALGVVSPKLATPDQKSVLLASVKTGHTVLRRVGNKVVAEPTTPDEQEDLK